MEMWNMSNSQQPDQRVDNSFVQKADVCAIDIGRCGMYVQNLLLAEFDIILQSNPSLQYDLVRTYRIDIQCSDGRRPDSSVFFMNVLRNKPPVFLNLQSKFLSIYLSQVIK